MTAASRSPSLMLPVALLLAVGAAWGAVPALARFAVTGGIHPVGYVFWVGLAAALITWAMCLARGVRPRFTRRHLVYYFLSGVTRFAIAGFLMYTALRHVEAGIMSVVLGTSPLMTLAASVALRYERLTLRRGAGVGLGLAGVVLLFAPTVTAPGTSQIGWIALGLLTPLIYASSNITIDRSRPRGEDSIALTAGMFTLVAVLVLPVAVVSGHFHPLWESGIALPEAAMFGHATIIAVCFYGLSELIRMTDATFGSQSTYITTLTGIVYGIILLGERPEVWVWGAAVCILGGVALVHAGRGGSGGG